MGKILSTSIVALAVVVGAPASALLVYDTLAIRPHLIKIDDLLANADPEDAAPPEMIRRLIDVNAGSPDLYAVRLVQRQILPRVDQGKMHIRDALWQLLLPLHLDEGDMYGLYASLAFNGRDQGMNAFALRTYGKQLDELSPGQAATTVAVTHAPSVFSRNPEMLAQRSDMLLAKAGVRPN